MKLVTVVLLVFGMLCSSAFALAEPVPFAALMNSASAQPAVPPMNDQSAAMSTPPAHPRRITSGGKAMIGTGIGLVVIGGIVMVGTAVLNSWATSTDKAELYGAGGGICAGGTALIVLGSHRRTAQ